MDKWVRVDEGAAARRGSGERTAPSGTPPERRGRATEAPALPADVATEIRRAAEGATAHHREVLVGRMERAVAAYDRNRFQEAARLGGQLASEVGQVPAVRRLAGFASYRLGRWRDAVRHFEAYVAQTEDADVLPALMDCQRALGRHKAVAELWADLRHAAPDADVLAEARIVAAGSLADRGDLPEAIEALASGGAGRSLRNPSERHLRQWYALADLYERAGDVPRARTLFMRVAQVDPDAYDVAERLAALGPERRSRSARRGPGGRRPAAAARRAPSSSGDGPGHAVADQHDPGDQHGPAGPDGPGGPDGQDGQDGQDGAPPK